MKIEVEEIWNWSWQNLMLKNFDVEEIYLTLKKFEVEEIWSWRILKLKKFEVEEIWSWKKLTKFEVKEKVEFWSWNLNLKFEIEDRSLLLKLKLHVFEIWSLNLKNLS